MGLLLEVSKHVDGYIEFDGILDRIVELKGNATRAERTIEAHTSAMKSPDILFNIEKRLSKVQGTDEYFNKDSYIPMNDAILRFWLNKVTSNDQILSAFESFLVEGKLSLSTEELAELQKIEDFSRSAISQNCEAIENGKKTIQERNDYVSEKRDEIIQYRDNSIQFVSKLLILAKSIQKKCSGNISACTYNEQKFLFCFLTTFAYHGRMFVFKQGLFGRTRIYPTEMSFRDFSEYKFDIRLETLGDQETAKLSKDLVTFITNAEHFDLDMNDEFNT